MRPPGPAAAGTGTHYQTGRRLSMQEAEVINAQSASSMAKQYTKSTTDEFGKVRI